MGHRAIKILTGRVMMHKIRSFLFPSIWELILLCKRNCVLCLVNGIWGSRGPALGCSCRSAILENTDSSQQVGLETPVLTSINEVNDGLRGTFRKTWSRLDLQMSALVASALSRFYVLSPLCRVCRVLLLSPGVSYCKRTTKRVR